MVLLIVIFENRGRLEYKRKRKLGMRPQKVYEHSVYTYYSYSANADGLTKTCEFIELPTPYYRGIIYPIGPYFGRGRADIWNYGGWWQDQWRFYKQGYQCVYTGHVPLPEPFTGVYGRPLTVYFYENASSKVNLSQSLLVA